VDEVKKGRAGYTSHARHYTEMAR